MFGSTRNHVVDRHGKIINNKKNVDYYLKPKKNNFKPIIIFLSLVIIFILGWVGINAYRAYSKVVNKNKGNSAPFLAFLNNVSPDKLKGEGDGRINILLLGNGGVNHPGGALTDTIQVISIDPNNKKIAMLSIPRDLYVTIPNYGGVKINEVYSIGEQNPKLAGDGPQLVKDTVSEILDLPIHYYIKLDFAGFTQIVDEIEGVDIDVPQAISDPYYPDEDMIGYEPFYIDVGKQHMNGTVALKYARSRETTSDFDRSSRQQQLLVALRNKTLTLGVLANPSKFTGILQVLGDHLRTDIQLNEMERLATLLKEIDTSKMTSKVLDDDNDGPLISYSDGGYYLKPRTGDFKEIQRIAHELFTDPYLQQENARLEVLNGTGEAGMGKDLADTLKSYGYNIVNLDVNDKVVHKTTIYDYSNGKFPFTVKFLQDRYAATVDNQPTTTRNGIDLLIIVGKSYTNNSFSTTQTNE